MRWSPIGLSVPPAASGFLFSAAAAAATAAIKASVFVLRLRDDYKPYFAPGQAPRRSQCYLVSRLLSSVAAPFVFYLQKNS